MSNRTLVTILAVLVGFLGTQLYFCHAHGAETPHEWAVGTILASDHWIDRPSDEEQYNEDQWPSLYVGWRYDIHTHAVGFYENSDEKTSVFYTYGQRYNEYVTPFIGGALGYDSTPLMPMIGVKINLGPVTVMPALGVTAFGLEYQFETN